MRRWLILALLLAAPAAAQDTLAPTFWGGYMWRQFLAQGVEYEGRWTMQRGDVWGGRLVGGLGFGRVGVEMRLDASGLKDQFNPQDPATFKTLEAYAALHYVAAASSGIQVGPIAVVGSMTSVDASEFVEKEWRGVGLNLAGAGARIAGRGSELELLFVQTRSYLALDPAWRLAFVAHVRLTDRLYAVGDALSGKDGFIRAGIAVRAF